ncbi:RimK/LysX family protein [Sulfurovum sp. zt1-1]|uniref:RimK/LysX family protein n=1 Tax=Sulfurovum zhangzhouensis TaxID=3019067 RepID=A0ABT7QXZ5_9BACT|nr:RimK/LysX family protein [Sulfurovum zhangzhouensis]MDM5271713.1 RimK/LysX family protein [Sulfurovum zhangzhouensis]
MKHSFFQTITVLAAGFILVSQVAAKEPQVPKVATQEQNTTVQDQNTTHEQLSQEISKPIIGAVEPVRVIPGNFIFDARIDTGATTTSLGVDKMEILTEDGKEWAEITINGIKSKHEVVKSTLIKQHGDESLKRYVIRLRLILGDVSEIVEVTLADRSNFEYKLLIGRNFLYERFVVDVSVDHTTTPKLYEEN